jgi:hypothetical protein
VAKVDELMALCDRLEAQQQERETRHAALARASLARFADAPTPANLRSSSTRPTPSRPPTSANPSSPSPSKENLSRKTQRRTGEECLSRWAEKHRRSPKWDDNRPRLASSGMDASPFRGRRHLSPVE